MQAVELFIDEALSVCVYMSDVFKLL